MKPDPADIKPELSCSVARPILQYLQSQYDEGVCRCFEQRAGIAFDYLERDDNWISFSCYNRLLDLLVEITGNQHAPYEVGLMGGKGASVSMLRAIAMQVMSIKSFYWLMTLIQRSYSKVADWKVRRLRRGAAVLGLEYLPPFRQTHRNCASVQGYLASIPTWLGLPPADVRHPQCAAEGASECVYEITWQERPTLLITLLVCLGGVVALWVGVSWGHMDRVHALWGGILGCLLICCAGRFWQVSHELVLTKEQNRKEADLLLQSLHNIEQINRGLQQRVEARTADLVAANQSLNKALQDLSESREKELKAERQAVVGVLAAGMAHEMNNPLNAVILTMQELREEENPRTELRPLFERADRALSRCQRIINELLAFAREPKVSLDELGSIVRDAVALFAGESSPAIQIVTEVASHLPKVFLDRPQIQQALLNLLHNAADAMQGKGEIEIALRAEGGTILLSITDHGPGMSEAVRQRIFEPFFTTKKAGKGLGLGLAITAQLVHRNGGTIEVASREGKGATFALKFPVPAAQESSAVAAKEPDGTAEQTRSASTFPTSSEGKPCPIPQLRRQ